MDTAGLPGRLVGRLARGQAMAEATMLDTFTAYSPTRVKVNGLEVDDWHREYDTRGSVGGRSTQATDPVTRTVTIGGVDHDEVDGGLRIPISKPVPVDGWEYQCIAIGPRSDPSLLGRRYHVVSVPAKSHATARRLDVVEVPGLEV